MWCILFVSHTQLLETYQIDRLSFSFSKDSWERPVASRPRHPLPYSIHEIDFSFPKRLSPKTKQNSKVVYVTLGHAFPYMDFIPSWPSVCSTSNHDMVSQVGFIKMDSFHKPSALSFDGNTSENWRRFRQQYDIYLTASASEKKDDTVKIAILLNFAGEVPVSRGRREKARQTAWTVWALL